MGEKSSYEHLIIKCLYNGLHVLYIEQNLDSFSVDDADFLK